VSLGTTTWYVLRVGRRRRSPDVEEGCQFEQNVADMDRSWFSACELDVALKNLNHIRN
jgi:hypothetical protein